MTPKITTVERLDPLEAHRFQEMVDSREFRLLTQRIVTELERARSECEAADDHLQLRRSQGYARALRVVLALPGQILAEVAKKQK